ncbi:MAG: glycosyltransferase family 2 protein [Fluviicola sp.]|nr:glycosyltransferase family 2 protein [Fluviicola sp.]
MKDIAIVILNWNGKQLLEQFLPQVIAYSEDARIIVADNASSDDSIEYLKHNFSSVEILKNSSNGGFAKGYNDALKRVDAEFYLLLNNDVEVTKNWLKPLRKVMENAKVAGCQPKILSQKNKTHFEHAGASGGFIDKNYFPFCRGRLFDEVEEDKGQYNEEIEIFWATGACLLIRSELYHKANGFDELFFAHMEEIDLCWRIKKWGYSFLAVPTSTVFHVGGGTLPYSSPRKIYYNFRNNLYMLVKNHDGLLFPKLFYRMLLDGIAAMMFLLKGQLKAFASVFNAHMSLYKNLGKLLKQRKVIKKGVTNFNSSGIYHGSILWAYFVRKIKVSSELKQEKFRLK